MHWLSLKDATTARSIISAIAGGIISLTVFSFSLVMIILTQAASQMSNRILDKLIGNRFQQIVLGFYVGTIVYALFLLSTIRDIESGVYVPALSTYLLIVLTVFDIFLFIYFLHYITQSVKYETIIYRIFKETKKGMEESCTLSNQDEVIEPKPGITVAAGNTGLFQKFQREILIRLCAEHDIVISFLYPVGSYLLKGTPYLIVSGVKEVSNDLKEDLNVLVSIEKGKPIENSYYYGFRQLMEVAVKALSPGINDPGTAVVSMQVLADLMAYRMAHFPKNNFIDSNGKVRIITREKTFDEIFASSMFPIWDYGENDRLVQTELHSILIQLRLHGKYKIVEELLESVVNAINNKQSTATSGNL